jgi:cell division septation protein DedD
VLNPNRVYDRLKEPAVLVESESPRASARIAELSDSASPNSGVVQQAKSARGAAQLAKQEAATSDATGNEEIVVGGDDIFSDTSDRLVIGSDDGDVKRDSLPSSVRVLGSGASAEVAKGVVDDLLVAKKDDVGQKIAAAEVPAQKVLEERIATARSGALANKGDVVEKPGAAGGLVRKSLPVGYFAQVAAPKKLSEAEGVAKRIKRAGFPVLVESATVNGQSFYRVVVGPEENKVQVERLITQLQKESLAGGSKPFIRRVK